MDLISTVPDDSIVVVRNQAHISSNPLIKFVDSGDGSMLANATNMAHFSHLRECTGFPDETSARMAILNVSFVTRRVESVT